MLHLLSLARNFEPWSWPDKGIAVLLIMPYCTKFFSSSASALTHTKQQNGTYMLQLSQLFVLLAWILFARTPGCRCWTQGQGPAAAPTSLVFCDDQDTSRNTSRNAEAGSVHACGSQVHEGPGGCAALEEVACGVAVSNLGALDSRALGGLRGAASGEVPLAVDAASDSMDVEHTHATELMAAADAQALEHTHVLEPVAAADEMVAEHTRVEGLTAVADAVAVENTRAME
jgi:hypothetical protein